jgi:acyl-CoA synthetase (AMP-forming)/AMP-acid ligase II
MPLYHTSAALLAFLTMLSSGGTLIIGRKFSTKTFWKDVRESDATVIQYVGETCRYLLAAPPQKDPETGENLDMKHKVKMAVGNGLRPDVWDRFKERFGIGTIAEFYASTEGITGTWNLSSNGFSSGAVGRHGLLVQTILGGSVAVVEVDWSTELPFRNPKTGLCKAVPLGQPGELLYRLNENDTKKSFQGYYNNKEATEEKIIRNVFRKGDAYFRTGDVIQTDGEGRWYFNDRIGDTFRWKSENVSTGVSPSPYLYPRRKQSATNTLKGSLPNPRPSLFYNGSQRLRHRTSSSRRPRWLRRYSPVPASRPLPSD